MSRDVYTGNTFSIGKWGFKKSPDATGDMKNGQRRKNRTEIG
jgi:hypothetical protein